MDQLIKTESNNYLRDTKNMALINNNLKAYQQYKKRKAIQAEKNAQIETLQDEVMRLTLLMQQVLQEKESS